MPQKKGYHILLFDFLYAPYHRVYQRLHVKKDGFQTYFNVQHLLIKLSSQERGFLDYLIEQADMQNRVYVDVDFKDQYCTFLRQKLHLKTVPAFNNLDKILKKLGDLGLIFREQGKQAFFRINPKYFWKGSEVSRKDAIYELIVNRASSNLPIVHLIDVPEDEFLRNMNR